MLEEVRFIAIPFISHDESNREEDDDIELAERNFRAAFADVAPRFGLVASNTALRDAIACNWVAFSSTLPVTEELTRESYSSVEQGYN